MTSQSSPTTNVFDAAKAIVESLKQLDKQQQQQAIRFASESLGLGAPASGHSSTPGQPPVATPSTAPITKTQAPAIDIRQFTESKSPRTDTQFAAVAAYYYQFEAPEGQKKDTIGPDDLREAARLVGRRRPGHAAQTLRNARNAGYLDNAETGRFRLSTVGENLVAVTLPGDGSGSTPSRSKKTAAKKRGKRGSKEKSGGSKKTTRKKKKKATKKSARKKTTRSARRQ